MIKIAEKNEVSHPNDAQTVEVVLQYQHALVTDDSQLVSVFTKYGGVVVTYDEFKEKYT
ncbi:hypothetical protein [Kaarinaea lacus]